MRNDAARLDALEARTKLAVGFSIASGIAAVLSVAIAVVALVMKPKEVHHTTVVEQSPTPPPVAEKPSQVPQEIIAKVVDVEEIWGSKSLLLGRKGGNSRTHFDFVSGKPSFLMQSPKFKFLVDESGIMFSLPTGKAAFAITEDNGELRLMLRRKDGTFVLNKPD